MRQKISEALQARFSGMDTKILERMAEKLAKTLTQSFDDDERSAANSKYQGSCKPDTSQGGGDGEDN